MRTINLSYDIPTEGICLPAVMGFVLGRISPNDWKSHSTFQELKHQVKSCNSRCVDSDIQLTTSGDWRLTGNIKIGDGKLQVSIQPAKNVPVDIITYIKGLVDEALQKEVQGLWNIVREQEEVCLS